MHFTAPYSLVCASSLVTHFQADHLANLRASGLSDKTIRAAGVYSIAPRDIAHFFNSRRGVPQEIQTALCFPYQGDQLARIKLFPTLRKMKYAQPPGTGARLYMPFAVDDRPLIVTEGEKKTLAAHQAGFNAVGIGGVWNWLSHGEPIADLQLIDWIGRDVTIIPDSDIFQRPDLLRAIYALGRELQAQGAAVLVAQIPQPSGTKVGLDDFLVSGGNVEALDVFALSHRIFKRASYWHGQWQFKNAIGRAA
jgi:putative DNA primase/helicase